MKLYVKWFHPYWSDHQVTFIQLHCLPIIEKTKTEFRLNSMLLITYRMSNITRGPKPAMTLTRTFLPFNPNHLVLDQFLSFSCFSFVLERWRWSLLIHRRSKWKNSSTKWQSPWSIVDSNRRIILPLQDDMSCSSVVIICSDIWILYLFICSPLSLFHSPRHDSRRRSLLMLVLSHSDTHYLSRRMA